MSKKSNRMCRIIRALGSRRFPNVGANMQPSINYLSRAASYRATVQAGEHADSDMRAAFIANAREVLAYARFYREHCAARGRKFA